MAEKKISNSLMKGELAGKTRPLLELAGRKVTVVGLARSGVAAANLLVRQGAEVTVTDIKTEQELGGQIKQLSQQVRLQLGGHPKGVFVEADLIVISPGIPLNISPMLDAQRAGIKIISEIELAYQLTSAPFIAVTGTNGKTTTTSLIGRLLSAADFKVTVGGNIGLPLSQEISKGADNDFWVAEISSFQLETIDEFRPHQALLLNISPDHLDRYASFEDYIAAKSRIFINQTPEDYAILNADEPLVLKAAQETKARRVFFSRQQELPEGVMVKGGKIMVNLPEMSSEISAVDELGLPGLHNLENVLAATASAVLCGMSSAMIEKILSEFEPLEHRMEFVSKVKGVEFINDSKGTNVGAVLKSLASFDQPVVLIAGGKDKDGDYSLLLDLVGEKVRDVVLIGEAKDKLKDALRPEEEKLHDADSMNEAVRLAFSLAQHGDVVLLSPACASFDMFADYEERGRVFKAAVFELEEQVKRSFLQ